jgi:hypothetical protein
VGKHHQDEILYREQLRLRAVQVQVSGAKLQVVPSFSHSLSAAGFLQSTGGGYNRGDPVLQVMMDQINSFLSTLKTAYSQQSQTGRILIPALFVLVSCCLCAITVGLFRSPGPSSVTSSPTLFPTLEGLPTPTALFDFDFPTLTPFPTFTPFETLPPPSPFPTPTPPPTETQVPTQSAPPATETPIPSDTATSVPPTATSAPSVVILAVHKVGENVDIQNVSAEVVDLAGWRLVSQTGNQSCNLSGRLRPNEVLKIWANRGPGFDCGLRNEIWLDNEEDPAVLYNAEGQVVSRFP